ncbi:MAG: hypothetical protein ACERKZ_15585 [Lachnotalea sp.]
MEKVVNKLSEIEAAAVAIMDSANIKKKELSDKMDITISEFDKEIDAKTARSLTELTKQLQAEKELELSKLKSCTQQTLESLDNDYIKNHSALADQIVTTIIKE